MAYRLKPGKNLGHELSRIVEKEFGRAIDAAGSAGHDATAVHEIRKHIKKLRAVLHLLHRSLGSDYHRHNRRLRTIGHQLSNVRDADAAFEVLRAMRRHDPRLLTRAAVKAVGRGLGAGKPSAAAERRSRRRLDLIRRELRRSAKAMRRDVRRATTAAAILAGVVRGYRRAGDAMREVRAAPEDVGFHKWRRRVKDHWYHVRLLEAAHASARARARQLKRLETWLGDDHNLVLLRATVLAAPSKFGDVRTTAVVLGSIDKYQASLRRRALPLGQRLFGRAPGVFETTVERWMRPND